MKRVFCLTTLTYAAGGGALAQVPSDAPTRADTVVITTVSAKATRPATFRGLSDAVFGRDDEKLPHKAVVSVADEKFDLYLPAGPYALVNDEDSDSAFENTATRVSIDANRDGKLSEDEHWFVNLPLRIGDSMFDVVAIAPDGSRIELRPSAAPLAGAIVGRRVPAFKFETADGKVVTQDDYKGKAFLLDIWSVT